MTQDRSNKPAQKVDGVIITELMNLAENLFDRGAFEECIRHYSTVIQSVPALAHMTYALYMRGCAYEEIGEVDNACDDWQQAKSLGFDHPLGVDIIDLALAKYR